MKHLTFILAAAAFLIGPANATDPPLELPEVEVRGKRIFKPVSRSAGAVPLDIERGRVAVWIDAGTARNDALVEELERIQETWAAAPLLQTPAQYDLRESVQRACRRAGFPGDANGPLRFGRINPWQVRRELKDLEALLKLQEVTWIAPATQDLRMFEYRCSGERANVLTQMDISIVENKWNLSPEETMQLRRLDIHVIGILARFASIPFDPPFDPGGQAFEDDPRTRLSLFLSPNNEDPRVRQLREAIENVVARHQAAATASSDEEE